MRRLALVALVAVAALAAVEVATRSGGDSGSRRAAPALPTQVLSGRPVTVADLRGRPAVVNFWASWCAPCRKEAAVLRRLADAGVRVVAVDWGDDAAAARAFVRRHGWKFPVLRDRTNTIGDDYRLVGLPTTFVLDRRGRIAATLRGPQTVASIRRALAEE
jgi:thiol-disulfide isomerase/thioredoxin